MAMIYLFIDPKGNEITVNLTHEDKAMEIIYQDEILKMEFENSIYFSKKRYKDFLIYCKNYIAIGPGYITYYGKTKLPTSITDKYGIGRRVENLQELEDYYSNAYKYGDYGDHGDDGYSW